MFKVNTCWHMDFKKHLITFLLIHMLLERSPICNFFSKPEEELWDDFYIFIQKLFFFNVEVNWRGLRESRNGRSR